MSNQKQSGGFWRRLFGKAQRDTDSPQNSVNHTVVPQPGAIWPQETKLNGNPPTWEELLNKIVPNNTNVPETPEPIPMGSNPASVPQQVAVGVEKFPWEAGHPAADGGAVAEESTDPGEGQSTAQTVVPVVTGREKQAEERDKLLQPESKVGEMQPIQNEQAKWLLKQAAEHTASADFEMAKKLLEIACTLERHPDVLLALAKHEKSAGNKAHSVELCLESLALYPDSLEALDLLATLGDSPVELDRLQALQPRTAPCCLKLAQICLAYGCGERAQSLFKQAEDLGMDAGQSQYDLGLLYENMGNNTKAVEHFRRDLELRRDPSTAYHLFDLYLAQQAYDEAQKLAENYFADRQEPEAIGRLARLQLIEGQRLYETGRLEEALPVFQASLERGLRESHDWAVRTLRRLVDHCLAESSNGQKECWQQAVKYLEQLQSLEPHDSKVIADLAHGYQNLGEFAIAAELLETLVQSGSADPEIREQLVNYYRRSGKFTDARRHLAGLYSPDSEEFRAGMDTLLLEQLQSLAAQGKVDQAWQICRRELPDQLSTELRDTAAGVIGAYLEQLAAADKAEEALQELAAAKSRGLGGLDLGLKEAKLYEQIGNDRAALEVYEGLASQTPEVWDSVKELYLKAATKEYLSGNLAKARHLLEEARAKMPDNEEVCWALGVLYLETGQIALAAALAKDAIDDAEIQISGDCLTGQRPQGYRPIRLK